MIALNYSDRSVSAALCYLFVVFHVEVKGQQCPGPIGTNNKTAFTVDRTHMFYLNTAAPAPCSGTVARFTYCYYRPPSNEIVNNHYATVAVYRKENFENGSFYYARVSDMDVIRRRKSQVNDNGNFDCLDLNNPDFEVEAGDVVGVCIFDPDGPGGNRRQLDLIGQTSGYSLMGRSADGCSRTTIPSTISSSQLSVISQRILHIYADITGMSKLKYV